jgi:adenine-specific DNA-methyltransferase
MQNLQNELIELLKTQDNLVIDGQLNKNKIIELGLKVESQLISLLVKNGTFKNHFFIEVDGVLVFDKIKFQRFVNNKSFLPDSYTAFKNKIGLTINDGTTDNFIKAKNDVVLAWAHKDCILEGGQTKEDQKRNEIFWNETLAPDNVDRLLDAKVFTNFKKYDKDGEHKVTKLKGDENLILKGNNLLSIASLLKKHRGNVKVVYIDPPYNTGGDANTFAYNNTFNHSSWLTFMKNRLEIAKQLLSNDGVITIAIDDEEYAHLKVLCDDIFGRENYIGTTIIQSNPRGRTTNTFFATTHEYCLFYANNIELAKIYNQPLTAEQTKDFNEIDVNGKYRFLPFRRSGGTSTPEERPNSEFTLYYSKKNKNIIAIGGDRIKDFNYPYEPKNILTLDDDGSLIKHDPKKFISDKGDDIITILPIDTLGKRRVWRWSNRLEILNSAKNSDFNIVINNDKFTVQLKDRIKGGRKPKTIWNDSKYDASASGTMLLKKLFDGEKLFSYPKSIHTVKDTLEILTRPMSNDLILDFFGGSGTTAHAVLELNKEDNGNRKFILCEQMDYIETVTSKRVQKIINNNQNESFIYAELLEYNQKYISQIQEAKTKEDVLKVWSEMQEKAFLSFQFNKDMFNERLDAFKTASLQTMQKYLIEILDKNQLYVNFSEIEDETFAVSEEDKALNYSFYKASN